MLILNTLTLLLTASEPEGTQIPGYTVNTYEKCPLKALTHGSVQVGLPLCSTTSSPHSTP